MTSKEEILALIKALGDVAVDVKKVMADGKVDLADISVIKDLVAQRDDFIAAVSNLGSMKLSELKIEDASDIVAALAAVGAEVAAA